MSYDSICVDFPFRHQIRLPALNVLGPGVRGSINPDFTVMDRAAVTE